jgi:threonine synthase
VSEIRSKLVCVGCGFEPRDDDPLPFRCPNTGTDDGDHVVRRVLTTDDAGAAELRASFEDDESNPLLRYRQLLHSYRAARGWNLEDDDFVARLQELDEAVAATDGIGLRETPLIESGELAARLGSSTVLVKDETGNVSGSFKGRQLVGLMLWLQLAEQAGLLEPDGGHLAISSCGNAALAAAVVAHAADRKLDVYVPPHANAGVVDRLRELDAHLTTCPRREGETGDPCYLRFREAVAAGSLPFTCQGSENGLVIDGGKTLVWEIVSQLAGRRVDRLFIQVGGGALATSCIQGLREAAKLGALQAMPRIHAVQTESAHPLERAYRLVANRLTGVDSIDLALQAQRIVELPTEAIAGQIAYAATHRSEFMWVWETTPCSIAEGILDDETYDWLAVVQGMLSTGGHPVVASEADLREANALARDATGIAVCHTGSAGLAGALALGRRGGLSADESIAVLFTGIDRTEHPR